MPSAQAGFTHKFNVVNEHPVNTVQFRFRVLRTSADGIFRPGWQVARKPPARRPNQARSVASNGRHTGMETNMKREITAPRHESRSSCRSPTPPASPGPRRPEPPAARHAASGCAVMSGDRVRCAHGNTVYGPPPPQSSGLFAVTGREAPRSEPGRVSHQDSLRSPSAGYDWRLAGRTTRGGLLALACLVALMASGQAAQSQPNAPSLSNAQAGTNGGELDVTWSWSHTNCTIDSYTFEYKKSTVPNWKTYTSPSEPNTVDSGVYSYLPKPALSSVSVQTFTIGPLTQSYYPHEGEVAVTLANVQYDVRAAVFSRIRLAATTGAITATLSGVSPCSTPRRPSGAAPSPNRA